MPIRRTIKKNQKKWLNSNKGLKILDLGCSNVNFTTPKVASKKLSLTTDRILFFNSLHIEVGALEYMGQPV